MFQPFFGGWGNLSFRFWFRRPKEKVTSKCRSLSSKWIGRGRLNMSICNLNPCCKDCDRLQASRNPLISEKTMQLTDWNLKCFLLPARASCRFQGIQSGIDREPESQFSAQRMKWRRAALNTHPSTLILPKLTMAKCHEMSGSFGSADVFMFSYSSIKAPPISGLFLTIPHVNHQ